MTLQDKIDKEYWIDTFGHEYKYSGNLSIKTIISIHHEIAKIILPNAEYPKDVLMKQGWILMGSTCYHANVIHKYPTQSQINALDKMNQLYKLLVLDGYSYIPFNKLNN